MPGPLEFKVPGKCRTCMGRGYWLWCGKVNTCHICHGTGDKPRLRLVIVDGVTTYVSADLRPLPPMHIIFPKRLGSK